MRKSGLVQRSSQPFFRDQSGWGSYVCDYTDSLWRLLATYMCPSTYPKNCTKRLYSGTCIKGHRIKRSLCIERSVVKVPKVVVTLLLNPTGLFVLSSTCIERSVKAEPLKYNRKKVLSTFINPCLSLEISVFERVFVRSPWWALVLVHKLTAWNGVFNRFITPPYRGTCTRR